MMFKATDSLCIWRAARNAVRAAAEPISAKDSVPRMHEIAVVRKGKPQVRALVGRTYDGIFIGPNDCSGEEEFWVPEDAISRFEEPIVDYLYAACIREEALEALLATGIMPSG